MLNTFCQGLVPPCSDAGPHVHNVGPLADQWMPRDWHPPVDLRSFLDKGGEPPICVGFGSMPCERAQVVLEVVERLGTRAVLVGDALRQADVTRWARENVCFVSSAPYAWLLPRCSVMLCHGGAGMVHATLRAGVPLVVCPLLGDQFFWAALLEAKGLGAAVAGLTSFTAPELEAAVRAAWGCAAQCRAAAPGREGPNGPGHTVALLRALDGGTGVL